MKRKYTSNLFDDVCGQAYSGPTRVKLFNSAKNSLSLVQRMSLMQVLPVHNGCVNSISWNETGEYLLSGSDDQHIVVTHAHTCKVLTDFKTTHRANIFSAKFMPGGYDNQVVSCAGDGIILFTDLNRQVETSRNHFNCHSGTTYEVITVPSDPHSFLSCGEDGTVRWFDLRQKNKCMKSQCKEDILISCQRAVTTLSINAMAPYQLAIGCSDSRVRLFDRRMLGTPASGHVAERDSGGPVCAFTAPQLEGQSYRITSLNFSPEGEELLVSFSSDHLYLFNIMDQGTTKLSVDEPPGVESLACDNPRHKHPSPPVRRLRLRGDWSDTGPDARPEREGGRTGNTSEVSQPRATLHATLMQRMTDVLSRMLNDPATRAALNGTGEHALNASDQRRTLNLPPVATDDPLNETLSRGAISFDGNSSPSPMALSRDGGETEGDNVFPSTSSGGSSLPYPRPRRLPAASSEAETSSNDGWLIDNSGWDDDSDGDSGRHAADTTRWGFLRRQMASQALNAHESRASTSTAGVDQMTPAEARRYRREETESVVPTLASLEARERREALRTSSGATEPPRPDGQSTYGALRTGYERNISNPGSEPSDVLSSTNYQDRNVIDSGFTTNPGVTSTSGLTNAGPASTQAANNDAGNTRQGSTNSTADNFYVYRPGPLSMRVQRPVRNVADIDFSNIQVNGSSSATVQASGPTVQDSSSNLQASGPSVQASGSNVQASASSVANGNGDESSADAQGLVSQSTQTVQERAGCSRAQELPATRAAVPAARARRPADSDSDGDSDGWLGDSDILPPRFLSTIDSTRAMTQAEKQKQAAARLLEDQCLYLQPTLKQTYVGHRNARTMIKEACFWGTDYVMSGSDCGHVFVWDRGTARLVALLPGDQHVVNCVQPHPTLPILATSGIDYDVKFWAPLAEEKAFDEEAADNLMKRNAVMLEETKDTITVPASFMIRMLACLNQIRRGGRTRANRRDQAE